MKNTHYSMMAFALVAALASATASAQVAPIYIPGHGRINQVNQRLANQQNRIEAGIADGQINAQQAFRDERQDANIAAREMRDEAEHGGHLTAQEQQHLNRSLNDDSDRIHYQRNGF
ncbi:hypothetical protein [Dyella sp. C9]|uniref:hypothetical protein n=1 Tax=Dyella sp. C9 TaxID=2202154 RepID=UPI000DEFFE64|nr:hypothetical protein [Dyella sp. C9]